MVALRTKVSDSDTSRARIRNGFTDSSTSMLGKLKSTIEEVADVDERAIETVIKIASLLWLEFGKQRFRLLFIVGGSRLDSVKDKINKAMEGTLEMVLKPQLRTFGDSRGMELEEQGIVQGCEGETFEVYK